MNDSQKQLLLKILDGCIEKLDEYEKEWQQESPYLASHDFTVLKAHHEGRAKAMKHVLQILEGVFNDAELQLQSMDSESTGRNLDS